MHPHKQKSDSNNLKTGIIIISLQIHLACSLAASLPFCQKQPVLGASKTFRYFRSLFYNRLKHASNCPRGGGGNAVKSLQRMVSIVPVKGQSSKTE